MARQNIDIKDFELLCEIVKSLARMAEGVKFAFDPSGFVVYAKNDYSKCNLESNAASSKEPVEFCISDLGMLLKVLGTVRDMYRGDYTSVSMCYDAPMLRIESGKFKTRIASCEEARISKFVASKIRTELRPMLEFTTSSQLIKAINGHSFIFQGDASSARLYITTEGTMQNNTIFATIGDESNDLSNSATLELGLVNSGTLVQADGTPRKIILDFNRLNVLNMVPSDEIKVIVAENAPVLASTVTKTGKNGAYFTSTVCSFQMAR